MTIINFILAILALIIAVMAYHRSGGTKDLREKTLATLEKLEHRLRKVEVSATKE